MIKHPLTADELKRLLAHYRTRVVKIERTLASLEAMPGKSFHGSQHRSLEEELELSAFMVNQYGGSMQFGTLRRMCENMRRYCECLKDTSLRLENHIEEIVKEWNQSCEGCPK